MTIFQAIRGKKVFKKLKLHKFKGLIVVLIDDNYELGEIAIKCAYKYKNKYDYSNIIFISTEELASLEYKSDAEFKQIEKRNMQDLTAFLLLKMDAVHRTVYDNVKIVTLKYYNEEYNYIIQSDMFDMEYVVWNRVFFTNEDKMKERG